jgi:hypothetical protein
VQGARLFPLTKLRRCPIAWRESDALDFTLLEWRKALWELRIAVDVNQISRRSMEIIYSRCHVIDSQGSQTLRQDLITMDNKNKDEHDKRCVEALAVERGETVSTFSAEFTSREELPTADELRAACRKRGLRSQLSLCPGAKLFLRGKEYPGIITEVEQVNTEQFQKGKGLKVFIEKDISTNLKARRVDLLPNVKAKLFDVTLAHALTAHMCQSQERESWDIALLSWYTEGEQKYLTFAEGQFYTALSRSVFPPRIYVPPEITDYQRLFNCLHLANPAAIQYLQVASPESLIFAVHCI